MRQGPRALVQRSKRRVLCSLALALFRMTAAQPAHATPEPERPRSAFWHALAQPRHAQADALVQQGRAQLALAPASTSELLGRVARDNALARFTRALALAPTHREARLWRAKTLARLGPARTAEAHAELEALRTLDPRYELADVAFELAVLHARTGALLQAETELARALALHDGQRSQAELLTALAEVVMLRGEPRRALSLFRRALDTGEAPATRRARAGLAVALDRRSDEAEALTWARAALHDEQAAAAPLWRDGALTYEGHYYEALLERARVEGERAALEPLARTLTRGAAVLTAQALPSSLLASARAALASCAEPATEALRAQLAGTEAQPAPHAGPPDVTREPDARIALAALRSLAGFCAYLTEGGSTAPFAARAREHVEELARGLTSTQQRAQARSPRAPR